MQLKRKSVNPVRPSRAVVGTSFLLDLSLLKMQSLNTAYIMVDRVFLIYEQIQNDTGMFDPSSLIRFNTMTERFFKAVEILSHSVRFDTYTGSIIPEASQFHLLEGCFSNKE